MAAKTVKAGVVITGKDATAGAFASLSKSLSKAENKFSKFKGSLSGVAGGLGIVGGMAAGAFAAFGGILAGVTKGAFDLANAANNDIDALADLSAKVGITATELDRLNYVAKLSGVEVTDAQAAWKKFAINLGTVRDKSSGQAKALQRLNPTLAKQLRLTTDNTEALTLSLDALSKMPAGYKRDQAAQALFGKQALAVLSILNQGPEAYEKLRKEAEKYGLVTDDMVDKSGAYGDAQDRIRKSMQSLKRTIGTELMPALTPAIEGLSEFILLNRDKIGKGVGLIAKNLGEGLKNFIDYLTKNPEAIGKFVNGVVGAVNTLVVSLKDAKAVIQDLEGLLPGEEGRQEKALKRAGVKKIEGIPNAIGNLPRETVQGQSVFSGGEMAPPSLFNAFVPKPQKVEMVVTIKKPKDMETGVAIDAAGNKVSFVEVPDYFTEGSGF